MSNPSAFGVTTVDDVTGGPLGGTAEVGVAVVRGRSVVVRVVAAVLGRSGVVSTDAVTSIVLGAPVTELILSGPRTENAAAVTIPATANANDAATTTQRRLK